MFTTVNTIKCLNMITSRIVDRMECPSEIKPKPSTDLENRLQADENFLCSNQLVIKFKHLITTDTSHNRTYQIYIQAALDRLFCLSVVKRPGQIFFSHLGTEPPLPE